jgi:hypothetical protein
MLSFDVEFDLDVALGFGVFRWLTRGSCLVGTTAAATTTTTTAPLTASRYGLVCAVGV